MRRDHLRKESVRGLGLCMCACVRACVSACVRAYVRACVCAYVRACMRATCVRVCLAACARIAWHRACLTLHLLESCELDDVFVACN